MPRTVASETSGSAARVAAKTKAKAKLAPAEETSQDSGHRLTSSDSCATFKIWGPFLSPVRRLTSISLLCQAAPQVCHDPLVFPA